MKARQNWCNVISSAGPPMSRAAEIWTAAPVLGRVAHCRNQRET